MTGQIKGLPRNDDDFCYQIPRNCPTKEQHMRRKITMDQIEANAAVGFSTHTPTHHLCPYFLLSLSDLYFSSVGSVFLLEWLEGLGRTVTGDGDEYVLRCS